MTIEEILSNKLIKLVFAAFFFLFIYGILYQMGLFFAMDQVMLDTYLVWVAVLMMIVVVLPPKKSMLPKKIE